MHAGQLAVSVETVRALVADQFPQWTNFIVEPVRSEGTVNAIFRLGDRLTARFPLQPNDLSVARTILSRRQKPTVSWSEELDFQSPSRWP